MVGVVIFKDFQATICTCVQAEEKLLSMIQGNNNNNRENFPIFKGLITVNNNNNNNNNSNNRK